MWRNRNVTHVKLYYRVILKSYEVIIINEKSQVMDESIEYLIDSVWLGVMDITSFIIKNMNEIT
jgi:hypothetical protein